VTPTCGTASTSPTAHSVRRWGEQEPTLLVEAVRRRVLLRDGIKRVVGGRLPFDADAAAAGEQEGRHDERRAPTGSAAARSAQVANASGRLNGVQALAAPAHRCLCRLRCRSLCD